MHHVFYRFIFLLCLAPFFGACQSKQNSKTGSATSNEELREQMIERNRNMLSQEKNWMEGFIEENGWQDSMLATGNGSYIMMDVSFPERPRIESQQEVTFRFRSFLLDGTALYEEDDDVVTWKIDRTDGTLGLHDILKKMAVGEQARALLPSYQAYGLAGDLNEVPPRSPIYFELEILDVRTFN
ncbi:MAG: hypothetical protein EA358_02860 [Flavobacteriales bacterium]|nr:MAG: hypothetical protein EA358_02860 [Flavobacteriales bacterium]